MRLYALFPQHPQEQLQEQRSAVMRVIRIQQMSEVIGMQTSFVPYAEQNRKQIESALGRSQMRFTLHLNLMEFMRDAPDCQSDVSIYFS